MIGPLLRRTRSCWSCS